jgi:four helix bundle protein
MAYRSFEDLEVWKRSCKLAVEVYTVLKDCKEFGLRDQMTRLSISIPSNIAEGAERDTTKEYVRFLHIAKGSAAERRTQIYLAEKIGILPS